MNAFNLDKASFCHLAKVWRIGVILLCTCQFTVGKILVDKSHLDS